MKNGNELVEEIAGRKPGSVVNLGVTRNGKKQDLKVTIADRQKLFGQRSGDEEENNKPG